MGLIAALIAFVRNAPARRRRWRALLALAVSPVVVAFVFSGVVMLVDLYDGAGMFTLRSMLEVWFYMSLFLGAVSFTFGWAFHALAFRLRWRAISSYIIGGLSIGALMWAAFFGLQFFITRSWTWNNLDTMYVALLVMGLAGALLGITSAAVFWFIRRPDRDVDSNAHVVFE